MPDSRNRHTYAAASSVRRKLHGAAGALALSVAVSLGAAAGCSDNSSNYLTNGGSSGTVPPGTTCTTPNTGCACGDPGTSVACGVHDDKVGTYALCRYGMRTCSPERTWGACAVDETSTRALVPTEGSLSLAGLGAAGACADNPCDPACTRFDDTPSNVDAGGGVAVRDGGLVLEGTSTASSANTCTGLVVEPKAGVVLGADGKTVTIASAAPVTLSPLLVQLQARLAPAGCLGQGVNADQVVPNAAWDIYDDPANPADNDRRPVTLIDNTGKLTVVSPFAGALTVRASVGNFEGKFPINVVLKTTDVLGGLAGTTANLFTGVPTVDDPIQWRYPYANTLFPLGIAPPLVQWNLTGQAAASSVKITLRYPTTAASATASFEASVFLPETNPPRALLNVNDLTTNAISPLLWRAFEQTAKGDTAEILIQRRVGAVTRKPVSRTISFLNQGLKGRIYYTQYGGTSELKMLDPSANAAPVSPFGASNGCPVCHSMSAQGNRLVNQDTVGNVSIYNGISKVNADGTMTVVDKMGQQLGGTTNWVDGSGTDSSDSGNRGTAWAALTPDGKYVLRTDFMWGNTKGRNGEGTTVNIATFNRNRGTGKEFRMYETADTKAFGGKAYIQRAITDGVVDKGLKKAGVPVALMTPSFSPDGTKLLAVAGGTEDGSAWRRGLYTIDFNQATLSFSNRRLALNANGLEVLWPVFESDSRSVLFQNCIANCPFPYAFASGEATEQTVKNGGFKDPYYGGVSPTSYGNQSAQLLAIDASVANAAGALQARASNGELAVDANRVFQPTVLPTTAAGKRWVVFTSPRPYGNVATTGACVGSQLWVAPLDDRPADGTDRSYPAFWLPNQQVAAQNSAGACGTRILNERAYWTLEACRPAAAAGTIPAGSLCDSADDCCQNGGGATCELDKPLTSPAVRHCRAKTVGVCTALAGACSNDADCCGYPTNKCLDGACALPPPVTLYSAATFDRTFVATCPAQQVPKWTVFQWQTVTPSDSKIAFVARTAATEAELGAATDVPLANASGASITAWSTVEAAGGVVNTGDKLAAASQSRNRNVLRIRMTFSPSADQKSTPTLNAWRQLYTCGDAE